MTVFVWHQNTEFSCKEMLKNSVLIDLSHDFGLIALDCQITFHVLNDLELD